MPTKRQVLDLLRRDELLEVADQFEVASRYILAWTLTTTMAATDVATTLDLARAKAGVDRIAVHHRPRLLSDNGPSEGRTRQGCNGGCVPRLVCASNEVYIGGPGVLGEAC